jgi:NADH-ubiquinone oxidoreductase chain 2
MLFIGLLSFLIAVPLFSYRITPSLFNRITSVTLLYSAFLSYNSLNVEALASGVGLYSGLFHVTSVSLGMEAFLLSVGAILLIGWAPVGRSSHGTTAVPTVSEYCLMILFTTIGASLLLSSSDMVSMYLSIELQSFAVYILATLYRNSESATAAGLKYFLLGGLSSALILLGTALIYSYTGLTQFESIYALTSVAGDDEYVGALVFGLLLIGIGFLFKVAAAPLHNWAPDVYDGTPTVVTAWLSTMPKISIFVFLLELQTGLEGSLESLSLQLEDTSIDVWKNLLLITSLLSLVIGTVLGLSQYRIKRLLTYSTISHVGFLLLALSMNTQESIESFLFYILQYTLTNANVFLVLLGFGYMIHIYPKKDIQFIDSLKGQFTANPLLSLSFALCLFSMAGIPPLIGFFAKQMVLYSSTHGGYYFLSIVAILVSVISASYYLKIIKVMYFDTSENMSTYSYNTEETSITNVHAFTISSLTMLITLFVLQPTILLNSCHILALSLFYY